MKMCYAVYMWQYGGDDDANDEDRHAGVSQVLHAARAALQVLGRSLLLLAQLYIRILHVRLKNYI